MTNPAPHLGTPSTVASLFAGRARVRPHALAIADDRVRHTYGALAERVRRLAASPNPAARAAAVAAEDRADGKRLPGFGHPVHRPVDPRTVALIAVARDAGVAGPAVAALTMLSAEVDALAGKPIPVNATGAVAAVLLDAGIPAEILRGVALISRCAGLVGPIREEQLNPVMSALWAGAEAAVPYHAEEAP